MKANYVRQLPALDLDPALKLALIILFYAYRPSPLSFKTLLSFIHLDISRTEQRVNICLHISFRTCHKTTTLS